MLNCVHHVAISTPDLARLQAFYCDLLGFREINRTGWPAGSEMINRVLGLADSAATTVMLQGPGLCIELFQFSLPHEPVHDPVRPVHRYGLTHICLDVSDIDVVYRRMCDAGVAFHCPPQDFGASRATYGRDPDGNVFELQEIRG